MTTVSTVSTHVLDLAAGRPAAGVPVSLDLWSGDIWTPVGNSVTGPDGRVTDLPPPGRATTATTATIATSATPASVRLVFAVRSYLMATHGSTFFPEITIAFTAEPGEHYHVPLLLSPFGYSTYRGS